MKNDGSEGLKLEGGNTMVELVSAALIVSGFWVLLELGRTVWRGTSRKSRSMNQVSTGPGREYVERYAEAFRKLADSYRDMPRKKEYFGDEEMNHIFAQVQTQVCAGCVRRMDCWEERCGETSQEIALCLQQIGEGKETAGNLENCIQPQLIREQIRDSYMRERADLMWNNRMLEQRAAAGEQIQDTAALLEQMAERIYQLRGLKEKEFARLEKELKYEKILCRGAWYFRRDERYPEVYLSLAIQEGACVQAKDLAEIISGVLRCRLVPAGDCRLTVKREFETFHYTADTEYQMFCGISRMHKSGELVSGDNFAFWQGDCGQIVMSLADGMGTGMEACRESEKVIELLEQFLDAGFSQETAVRMINSSMVLQDHMRMFSTIDLCMVDLYNGMCSMIKAGACPTCLLHSDETELVCGRDLPAGICQEPEYETVKRCLKSGDQIVMMTDGVLDALPEENRECVLVEMIKKARSQNAKEFARRLMEQILLLQKFQVRDDMTVLVGQLWAKQ